MIEFVKGNFFDFEADVRINTVNCVGVMGAGAALQFKTKYPNMYDEYVQECKLGKVKIGKPHVWTDQNFFNNSPIIINFPTKEHWKKPSEYDYVEKGLIWLRNYLIHNDTKTITLPALGCGHGGLDWGKVKPMIEHSLNNINTKILVFEPESSTKVESSPELELELTLQGIKQISPSDPLYPFNIVGKAASEILVRGNASLLNHPRLLSILINTKASDREKSAVLKSIESLNDQNDFVCFMAYNSSFEIDMIKQIIEKKLKVILLVPYGILNVKLRKDIKVLWDEQKMAIASLSKPKQTWNAIESIKSLKFRMKASKAVLITHEELDFFNKIEKEFIEADTELFYLNYWNVQPDFFYKIHAKKIGLNKETMLPNLIPIYNSLSYK
jgi:O-acetyl-ADP-ribose deacetylase (regulator of RNase III)